ncbi:hypothetical protein BE221DRAFT_191558 [Ostreococcus tauri]|nr:hypothetical protein BE221DRAFT_191558 [Ostreococcus tauri]
MDPGATPFDLVLRYVVGKTPNLVDQSALGGFEDEFVVCHRDARADARWDDASGAPGSLAGADRVIGGLPGHVVISTRDARWQRSNVCALGLGGDERDRREATAFLLRMREAAMTYARARGWTRLGLYFRFFGCEPEGEEEPGIIRLHAVNLARAGPWLRRTAKVNLPIDDVIEALGGARASRRGAVLIVSPGTVETIPSHAPYERSVDALVDDADASESSDEEIEVLIKRVVGANTASAPPLEDDVVIPEQFKRHYESVSSAKNVRTAVRDVQDQTMDGDSAEASGAFFDDLGWLRAYKTLSSPAHVQRALREVGQ